MTDIIQYEGIENLGTTTDLINGKPIYDLDRIIETSGFTTAGDGGAGKWKQNGVTGQTPSQTPAQLGDALINDASGNQWEIVLNAAEIHAKQVGCKLDAEELLDSATDDTLAARAAHYHMLKAGGGEVILDGLCAISDTIEVNQRVIFKGKSKFFANQFTNNEVRPAGCGFYALPSMNKALIDVKLDIYNDNGTLREKVNNKVLNDYRHFGGLSDLIVYGNRSNTVNPPSTNNKNTGDGVLVSGSRYAYLNNIVIMMSGNTGLVTESEDYGLGAISCNNHEFSRVTSLSNSVNGASISGGDCVISDLICGYNGVNGLSSTAGSGSIKAVTWNNQQDGINISGGRRMFYTVESYDNKRQGVRIINTNSVTVKGIVNANGRDTGLGASQRSGVLTGDSNTGLRLDITSDGKGYTEDAVYQAYGFNINNTTNEVIVSGSYGQNNFTSNWLVSNNANLIKDSNAP